MRNRRGVAVLSVLAVHLAMQLTFVLLAMQASKHRDYCRANGIETNHIELQEQAEAKAKANASLWGITP